MVQVPTTIDHGDGKMSNWWRVSGRGESMVVYGLSEEVTFELMQMT